MFQPVVPVSGVAGLRFIESTRAQQQEAFDKSPLIERNVQAFKERIGNVLTAEQLVQDRQLFEVALGAFGLDEEINKVYFMQKILEEGTETPDALAMQFVDPRYRQISEAFGFGGIFGPQTITSGFADQIADEYRTRQFEIALGNADPNMRLAIGFKREIASVVGLNASDDGRWFSVMGSRPMRTVFETAYNLPAEFATIPIEKQAELLRDRTQAMFGDGEVSVFSDPANVDELVERFLALAEANNGPTGNTPGMAALTLLSGASNGGLGAAARINLILSNA